MNKLNLSALLCALLSTQRRTEMNKLNLSALLLCALLSTQAAAVPTFSRLPPTIISADANHTVNLGC